jgi:adenylate cyclase, class 2
VKTRRLLLWRNVRIHLDVVERLGTFVELESVVDVRFPEPAARANLQELIESLSLGDAEIVAVGYVDLMRSMTGSREADE